MSDERPATEPVPLEAFLQRLANVLGPDAGPGLSDDEQDALLHIARIAAHTSERIAAPLTTYVAGLACAGLPTWERGDALRSLAEQLER